MADWKNYDLVTKLTVGAIVAILIGTVGYQVVKPKTPVVPPAPAVETAATTDKAAAEPAAAEPAPAAQAPAASETPAATPAAVAPTFDVMRLDPDGSAVVAGQVAAGAKVSILVDGAEVGTATADDTGKFVAMFDLPPAAAGRLMTMVATLSDGTQVTSPTSVALAATAAPPVVADATDSTATTAPAQSESAPAQTGTTALAVNDQGAKVLQTDTNVAAEVASNVTIDTIAYPSPEVVQFGGHGTAGNLVRLYLDNAPLGDAATVGADGTWNLTQTGIEPKVYILRADELDASGKVASRYETPFKRETSEALAEASTAKVAAVDTPAPAADAATPQPSTTETAAAGDANIAATTAPVEPDSAAATQTSTPQTAPADSTGTAADKTEAPAAEVAATPAVTAPPAVTVTVQPGFTLWGIAKQNMGDGTMFVQVYEANKDKIKNPNLIYPGQILTLPEN